MLPVVAQLAEHAGESGRRRPGAIHFDNATSKVDQTESESSTAAGRSSRKRDQLQTTASIALDIVANVTGVSDILAPLTAACKTTKSIIDTIDDNQGDWNDLVRRLEEYMWAIESQIDSLEKYPPEDRVVDEAFSQPLIRYVELLEDIHCAIVNNAHKRPRTRRSAVMAIGNVKIDAGLIRKFNRDIEDRHRQFMEALALFTGHRIQVIEQHTKSTAAKVETIVSDIDASFICQLQHLFTRDSSGCSREIKTWAEDDTSDKPIFWLCDVAGSGKSTVAMSAAETWPRRRIPKSSARRKRVVLIVDAVDECKSGPQRSELLDTFVKAARESRNLKIFITSRPDPLEDRLHDITYRDNMDDIATYVHESLYTVLPEDKRQQLIEKAHGLFIWASTACRMINSKTAWDTPETIYDWLTSVDQSGDIDDVYKLIFERVDPRFHTVMCGMLALLLAAFEPLTANDLDNILKHIGLRGYSDALIRNLGSVLIQDKATKVIQFRHPTLVEYLQRCYDTPVPEESSSIYINIHDAHGQIASWCFSNLQSRQGGLKFNVCEIESSFYRNRDLPDLEESIKFIGRNLDIPVTLAVSYGPGG
ncbi:SubName: Full=Uncharacterized protein {ECO:0000313/EMBL:CCA75611.1} [Serendipita indica DSM 11827]|nr:SubName: Full=Uncharacterized protein {ECO:0000313/EMBL:CCA75611.1} [Serendipita indica DSM 11827]